MRPGYVRQTASDRPGVAQPVPERDIPVQPWGRIFVAAIVLTCVALAGWEAYWRAYGAVPGYLNSKGSWAEQRRRIDAGDGDHTVLIGASRILFGVELPVWEKLTGERPIQLALEGTSPVPFLEDLADDTNFTGRLLIGVAPDVFFGVGGYRRNVLAYYRKQSPSQRSDHWLSQHLMEPYFAFYDPDFALATVIERLMWPVRPGLTPYFEVRKLAVVDADRNARMWRKLEVDPAYQALARSIWAQDFGKPPPDMETPEKRRKVFDEQIAKAASAIAKLRARGVPVVFVRPPSTGEYYTYEQTYFPREETWDPLLQRAGAPGIHFEDHPQLQSLESPEWSHLTSADADRFTAALVPLVMVEFAREAR